MLLFICAQLFAAEPSKESWLDLSIKRVQGSVSWDHLTHLSFPVAMAYRNSSRSCFIWIWRNQDQLRLHIANRLKKILLYGDGRAFECFCTTDFIGARYRHRLMIGQAYMERQKEMLRYTIDFAPSISEEDQFPRWAPWGFFWRNSSTGWWDRFRSTRKFQILFWRRVQFSHSASFDSIGDLDCQVGILLDVDFVSESIFYVVILGRSSALFFCFNENYTNTIWALVRIQ